MLKLSSKYLERRRQNGAASPSQCACVCTLTLPAIPAKVERPLTDFLHVCVFHFTCVCVSACVCVYACALPYLVGQPASECLPVCLSERERDGVCVCGVLCTLDVASCFKQLPTSPGSACRLLNKQHIHRPLQDGRLGCRV